MVRWRKGHLRWVRPVFSSPEVVLCVAVPSTDDLFCFFSRLREPCFFLAIPGLLLFERPSGARADGVGCSDGGTVCDRFVIGL